MFVPAQAASYYQLKNGLQVLVEPVSTAPVVLCSIWYRVGSSYETDGYTGISHVLEHLMFMGTKNHPAGSFSGMVRDVGGQQNAFTGADYTAYYEKVPVSFLPKALEMEADRMHNLQISPRVFANEMDVVKEERRLRVVDDPQSLTLERYMAAAHINSPYNHPVIGWDSDLNSMTISDVRQWYDNWYAPNNAVLVIVGNVKPGAVKLLADKYFSKIASHKLPTVKPRKEVDGVGVKAITVQRPAKQPWLVMGYAAPSLTHLGPKQKWQAYALVVLAGVLDSGGSSRLPSDLLRGKQLVSSVNVNYTPYRLYNDLFTFTATPAAGVTTAQVKKSILEQVNLLKTQQVSSLELAKVQAQVIAADVYRKDSLMQQMFSLGRLVAIRLPWQEDSAFVHKIREVTVQQVQYVAQKYLVAKSLTIAVLQPQNIPS